MGHLHLRDLSGRDLNGAFRNFQRTLTRQHGGRFDVCEDMAKGTPGRRHSIAIPAAWHFCGQRAKACCKFKKCFFF